MAEEPSVVTKTEQQDPTPAEVLRVGVRVPQFLVEEPALWFAQIEGQFILSRITSDETKFYYVAAQLEPPYAREVKDIITNPPRTDKYLKLKTELIRRLSASQEKRIQQLLNHEELGDRKPSQFLRHLQNLAGASAASDFIKTLWSSRLPINVQTVIASQLTDLPLDKLAELADKVHEIAPMSPQVASTSTAALESHDSMAKQISELTRQVALLTTQLNRRGRSKSHSRLRSRSRSKSYRPKQPPPNHPHCFYHYTYGAKANKCKQPCTFKAENLQGGRM